MNLGMYTDNHYKLFVYLQQINCKKYKKIYEIIYLLKFKNMKKVFGLFIVASLFALYACNNEESDISPVVEIPVELQSIFENDAIVVDTEEKFFSMFPEITESTVVPQQSDDFVRTRSATPHTVYGFTSYTSNGLFKTAFNATNAAYYGLPPGTYFVEYMIVRRNVIIAPGSRFLPIYGSGGTNGWLPSGGSQCGYSSGGSGIKYYMETRVSVVRYNASGQQLDIWAPTTMANLWWNYETE